MCLRVGVSVFMQGNSTTPKQKSFRLLQQQKIFGLSKNKKKERKKTVKNTIKNNNNNDGDGDSKIAF